MEESGLIEREVRFRSGELTLAGSLVLPAGATPGRPAPAVLMLGGSGGDTRDGDIDTAVRSGYVDVPKRRTFYHLSRYLALRGIASLRFDKRGFAQSEGQGVTADYDTDLADNAAAFAFLTATPEVDGERVGVVGHSAGALNACRLCGTTLRVKAVVLQGALYSSLEDLLRANAELVLGFLRECSAEDRNALKRLAPRNYWFALQCDEILKAARAGAESVRLGDSEWQTDYPLQRIRQELGLPASAEFHKVRCPALVLHGAEDLNVSVEDALKSFQELRRNGNRRVDLVILAGLDHSFQRVPEDRRQALWERITLRCFGNPLAEEYLETVAGWLQRWL